MKEKKTNEVSNKSNNIAKIKMQIIINKELFYDNTIDFDTYKIVEDKLIEKLNKLKEFYSF